MLHLDILPVVCISLDRRPDRWQAFQERAANAGLHNVQRLSAVDAKSFDAIKHPSVAVSTAHNLTFGVRRSPYEIDVPGAVGASLSHFKAWTTLVESSAPAMIVFEDDSPLPTDFRSRLETVLTDANKTTSFDVILFHRTNFGGGTYGCSPNSSTAPFQTCDSLAGAHAYLVTRAGAQKLLARAYPIELHVDAYMAFMSRLGHIQMAWHPALDVGGNWDDSDIHHRGGRILELPTNMERAGVYALNTPTLLGVVVLAGITGALLGAAVLGRGRK